MTVAVRVEWVNWVMALTTQTRDPFVADVFTSFDFLSMDV